MLEPAIAEIEDHVHSAGWDRGPSLFALVRAVQFAQDDPETARRLGIDKVSGDGLTPVEQEDLPDEPRDEVLAGIACPAEVDGCAVSQEIVILPPSAEAGLTGDDLTADQMAAHAAGHPERREARLVVGVLRDGSSAVLLRMRSGDGASDDGAPNDGADDLLTGPDLAPNLVAALRATLS
ncbi:MAG: PPA1309 family protein [Actinomycetota bacterium]|nr:PPA1309 family protein [Actinomycetota bacterium]